MRFCSWVTMSSKSHQWDSCAWGSLKRPRLSLNSCTRHLPNTWKSSRRSNSALILWPSLWLISSDGTRLSMSICVTMSGTGGIMSNSCLQRRNIWPCPKKEQGWSTSKNKKKRKRHSVRKFFVESNEKAAPWRKKFDIQKVRLHKCGLLGHCKVDCREASKRRMLIERRWWRHHSDVWANGRGGSK